MKNYILSIVLVLSINAISQTNPTTTPQTKPTTSQSKSTAPQTKPKSTKSTATKPKAKPAKPETDPGKEVVKKALYTPEEKEKTRQHFIKDVDSIGMSPEVKAEYTKIVKKHWSRIEEANNERKLTKDQATDYVNRVIREQNDELQPILTVEQYNKHINIMNRYANSVLYRIEQQ